MSDNTAISVANLRKTYKGDTPGEKKEALKDVSLEVTRGAFFGLLGPNGAGKSTMINIMAGITLKTSGSVSICGYNIDEETRNARLSIGVVPQELVLDTFFTVREALEIQAGYYGVPTKHRRTDAIIKALGLEDKADVNSRRLSGGMRRRLLVGKALVHNPDVLILDEPTAGVDVELRTQLWEYVKELNANGTTILLTTHYLEEAEELCDSIAIINHGEVIAHESKEDLMKRFDSKQLKFKLSSPLTTLTDGLKKLGASIDESGGLIIKYQPSQTCMESILDEVKQTGFTIHDLITEEVDLEDIFRHLTS
jgi:ABC-2 type transport system ATP-binding protein